MSDKSRMNAQLKSPDFPVRAFLFFTCFRKAYTQKPFVGLVQICPNIFYAALVYAILKRHGMRNHSVL